MTTTTNIVAPIFRISYDHVSRSIYADFSKPFDRDLTMREEEAMSMIAERFLAQSPQFNRVPVTAYTFEELKAVCHQIIMQVYQETGIQFELNTAGIHNTSVQPRFCSWY
jgi:phage regulator Rha-like protein